jgi:hypothetical protein
MAEQEKEVQALHASARKVGDAYMRRTSACLDACRGIPTADLERVAVADDPIERLWRLGDACIRAKDELVRSQLVTPPDRRVRSE